MSAAVVDATASIEAGFKNHGYRQGTKECVAFYRGACWQLERSNVPDESSSPFWCHEQSHDRPRCAVECTECADDLPPYFCNKCGYRGPVQVGHQRPNGSGECGYMATIAAGVPPLDGGQSK